MGAGRPPKYATPEELQTAIDCYFDECDQSEPRRPYTIMGLAMSINLTRQGLCEYADKGQFSDVVRKAKEKVERSVEERLFGQSCTGAIFWLKNHAGYRDKTEQEHSGAIEISKVERTIVKPPTQ